MFWLSEFFRHLYIRVVHAQGILNSSYFYQIISYSIIFFCCLARPIGWIQNADIWMERPEALENARGIRQISFLSGRDNWDLIPLGQQMEVVKTEPLNGMNLWVKGLGAVPCKQFCFFPACEQSGSQISGTTMPLREKRNPNHPWVSTIEHSCINNGAVGNVTVTPRLLTHCTLWCLCVY